MMIYSATETDFEPFSLEAITGKAVAFSVNSPNPQDPASGISVVTAAAPDSGARLAAAVTSLAGTESSRSSRSLRVNSLQHLFQHEAHSTYSSSMRTKARSGQREQLKEKP